MFADEGEGKVRLGGVRIKGASFRQEFDDSITDTVGVVEVTRVLGQSAVCTAIEGEAAEGDTLEPVS